MKFKTLSVASSLAIMASMAAPAYAQDEGDDSTRTNTIVVTAEFREANLQDTPIAITAVNAEMLEARGQTGIEDVAAQAPNVSLRPQPQNGGSGLIAFIRGVGQVDFNYALDPGVGVYVDDVFIPTLSSSLLELIDLERVEILRGPQGHAGRQELDRWFDQAVLAQAAGRWLGQPVGRIWLLRHDPGTRHGGLRHYR